MNKKLALLIIISLLTLPLLPDSAKAQAIPSSVFASGLQAPIKIITTPKGNLLVAESGNGPNSGRLSILDLNGNRRTLLDGLPAGFAPPNNEPIGPTGLAMRGRTLYVTIGSGDGTLNGPVPTTEIPNPTPSSPFLSAVLSIRLSPQAEETTTGFTMTVADQTALLNQGFLRLRDALGNEVIIEVVTNFRNFTFEPRPNFAGNVRPSNPFGVVLRGNTLYVVDAAQNLIWEVDADSGEHRVLTTFASRRNPLPIGAPFIDAVPDSIRLVGKSLLVSFLVGFPFPAGQADVRKIRLVNKAEEPFISGLTSAIDVLPATGASGQEQFFTLEFSTAQLMEAPGRLSRFNPTDNSLTVLVNNLVTPTSLARDATSGDLFITEIATGRIIRVRVS